MIKNGWWQKGITLIEIVIVLVVLGVIGGLAGKLILQAVLNARQQSDMNNASWQTLIALQRMESEIRSLRSNRTSDFFPAEHTLIFTDTTGNTITYSLSGSQVLRNAIPFAAGVAELSFTYLDGDENPTATLADIRYVGVTMTLQQQGSQQIFNSLIFPRVFLS